MCVFRSQHGRVSICVSSVTSGGLVGKALWSKSQLDHGVSCGFSGTKRGLMDLPGKEKQKRLGLSRGRWG